MILSGILLTGFWTAMRPKALFSAYDKTNIEIFAQRLVNSDWEVVATKGTAKLLNDKNITCTPIDTFVDIKTEYGVPPTLHPKIEACLTLDCEDRIDLVYIINYPLSVGNDVGGHTLLSLAAKGKRLPICTIEDMDKISLMILNKNIITSQIRQRLINKAHRAVIKHYSQLKT